MSASTSPILKILNQSASKIARFTPAHYDATEATPPVYLIAVPTLMERCRFNRMLTEQGAFYVSDQQMMAIIRAGISDVVIDAQQAELLEVVSRFEAAEPADRLALASDMLAIEASLTTHYPPYLRAIAAREHWLEVVPLIACRRFLTGWEDVEAAWEADRHGVTDDCLQLIPARDIAAIGWKAVSLMNGKGEA